jgi:hypothetical protein
MRLLTQKLGVPVPAGDAITGVTVQLGVPENIPDGIDVVQVPLVIVQVTDQSFVNVLTVDEPFTKATG